MKTCDWCGVPKPLSGYWRAVNQPDGRQVICIECHTMRSTGARADKKRVVPIKSAEDRTRRRSPYSNMADVLNQIEADPEGVQTIIVAARQKYGL